MSRIPYGYVINDGEAKIHPEEAAKLKKFFKSYANGESLKNSIEASGLNMLVGSGATLLRKEVYLGDDFFPKIIDETTFKTANELISKRGKRVSNNKKKLVHDLNAPVICEECGTEFKKYKIRGEEVWYCKNRFRNGLDACDNNTVFNNDLRELITKTAKYIVDNISTMKVVQSNEKIEVKFNDPIKQAEYAYTQLEVDYNNKVMELIKNIDKSISDINQLSNLISKITVSHQEGVSFLFLNGRIVTQAEIELSELLNVER